MGTRCRRKFGTGMVGRWSMNGENEAFIRGGGDMVCRLGETKIGGPRFDHKLGGS